MKTKSNLLKYFVLCLLLFVGQTLKAESEMSSIIKRGQVIIALLESTDEEIVSAQYDLIHKSNPQVIYRTLSSDYTYTLTGFAQSDRISDLDIIVYKKVGGEWVEEAKDVKTDATPIVSVKPSYTREYKIVLKGYSWQSGYDVSCYGLIVSHD